jgi:hypothetical protein
MKTRSQRECKGKELSAKIWQPLVHTIVLNQPHRLQHVALRPQQDRQRLPEPTVGNLRVRVLHEETGRANQRQHFLQERLAGGVGESAPDQSRSGQSLHQQVQVEGDSEESEIGMCRTFSKATPFIPMNVSSEVLEVKIGQRIAEVKSSRFFPKTV